MLRLAVDTGVAFCITIHPSSLETGNRHDCLNSSVCRLLLAGGVKQNVSQLPITQHHSWRGQSIYCCTLTKLCLEKLHCHSSLRLFRATLPRVSVRVRAKVLLGIRAALPRCNSLGCVSSCCILKH